MPEKLRERGGRKNQRERGERIRERRGERESERGGERERAAPFTVVSSKSDHNQRT